MKRFALLIPLALVGCGGQTAVPAVDITGCTTALFAAGIASPAALLPIALATPSCIALGRDLIDQAIVIVSKQQLARGVRQ
jgi:hypothetical protein